MGVYSRESITVAPSEGEIPEGYVIKPSDNADMPSAVFHIPYGIKSRPDSAGNN